MKRTLQISTKKWVKKNSSQYSYAKTPKVRSSRLLCGEGFVYVCMSAAGLCFAKSLLKETAKKKKNSFVANVKAEKENATKQKQIKKRAERKKQKKKKYENQK